MFADLLLTSWAELNACIATANVVAWQQCKPFLLPLLLHLILPKVLLLLLLLMMMAILLMMVMRC
jgi:hypothetical protein